MVLRIKLLNKILITLILLFACGINTIIDIFPTVIWDSPILRNDKELIMYIHDFYEVFHEEEKKYPDSIGIISEYMPIESERLKGIRVETTDNEIQIYSKYHYVTESHSEKYSNIFPDIKELISNHRNNIYIYEIISFITILITMFVLFNRLKKSPILITDTIIIIILLISNFILTKYDSDALWEFKTDLLNEKYIMRNILESSNKDYKSECIEDKYIFCKNEKNEYVILAAPEYYMHYSAYNYGWFIPHKVVSRINPIRTLIYDYYTKSYYIQYDYLKNFMFKDKIYLAIFIESYKKFSILLISLIILSFIIRMKKKAVMRKKANE